MGWLGPVVGEVEHEGWVVPLFADGAEGSGTSSARGILVARRPGELCDGDRLRVFYRDGTVADGVWHDGSLIRDSDGRPAPTAGQTARELLTEAEQWRPDAAVIGWAAGCGCGWRGRPWTRVRSAEQADPGQRLLAVDGPYADLDAASERHVIDEWRTHIAPYRTLEQLSDAADRQAEAARALEDAVRAARAAGASWADVGRATGVSRQSAQERWSTRG